MKSLVENFIFSVLKQAAAYLLKKTFSLSCFFLETPDTTFDRKISYPLNFCVLKLKSGRTPSFVKQKHGILSTCSDTKH